MKLMVSKGYCTRLWGFVFDRVPGRRRVEFGIGLKVRLVVEWR